MLQEDSPDFFHWLCSRIASREKGHPPKANNAKKKKGDSGKKGREPKTPKPHEQRSAREL